MVSLSANTYGKSRIRLVKVRRGPVENHFSEWTVHVLFEGPYDLAFIAGDNSIVLPTDTMKNTVYSLARSSGANSPEEFALELAQYFLDENPETRRVSVEIQAKPWEHLTVRGRAHPHAFRQGGRELETTIVAGTKDGIHVRSGLSDLTIMKTANSGFEHFKRDKLTTLRETSDRLLGTNASAEWGYAQPSGAFIELRSRVRDTLLTAFTDHESRSVQHTLYAMGEAVLNVVGEVTDIQLTLPNIHCLLVDLSPFGQDNPNEIFVPVDEPHGYIQAHLKRT